MPSNMQIIKESELKPVETMYQAANKNFKANQKRKLKIHKKQRKILFLVTGREGIKTQLVVNRKQNSKFQSAKSYWP